LSCDKGVTGGKSGAHDAFWKNFRAKAGPEVASIDLSQTVIMDYQLTARTTANVARVEELIRSHGVAPSSVIRFHQDKIGTMSLVA